MLTYFTAIYFFLLLAFYYNKNGFDIACCIISIYLFTSIGAIFLFENDVTFSNKEPSIVPTLIYCSMITLVSWPFYKFNSNKVRSLQKLNIKVFNILSWIFILSFVFSFVLFFNDIIYRIKLGDQIGALRGENVETAQAGLSGPLRLISTFAVAMCSMSSICIILFFYSVSFLKKSKKFNALLLTSSAGCIIAGIIGIDRSIMFYWVINFIFIYVLFKQYLSAKIKRIVSVFGIIALCGIGIYMVTMTVSRFGDGALDSVYFYMGQNYLYFCWFWDNYEAPVMNFGIFLPVLSHFFIDWGYPVSAVPFGYFVQNHVGYFVNYFYTFMGSIMLYLGQWAVLPYCIIYSIIAKAMISIKKSIGLQNLIILYILALVPYDGVILYTLVDYVKAFGIIIVFIFCRMLRRNNGLII